jgi:hypothetical protein
MSRKLLGSRKEASVTETKATLSVDIVRVEFNSVAPLTMQSIYLVFVVRMEELWN